MSIHICCHSFIVPFWRQHYMPFIVSHFRSKMQFSLLLWPFEMVESQIQNTDLRNKSLWKLYLNIIIISPNRLGHIKLLLYFHFYMFRKASKHCLLQKMNHFDHCAHSLSTSTECFYKPIIRIRSAGAG